ncbi:MAG: hypothetical protein ACPGOY_12460 [Rhodospirillaceae bacterium]
MSRKLSKRLVANRKAVFRSMGEDLVVVNEEAEKLVVLNATARFILDGLVENLTDNALAKRVVRNFDFEGVQTQREAMKLVLDEIKKTREDLVSAGVLVNSRPFTASDMKIRDLKEALADMDLTPSEVSQFE